MSRGPAPKASIEEMERDYARGMSVSQIARKYGYSRATRVIKHLGLPCGDRSYVPYLPEELDAMMVDYYAGMTFEMIADKYGRAQSNLQIKLKEHGLKTRTGGPWRGRKEDVVADYCNGMSCEELAAKYGYKHKDSLRAFLKKRGVWHGQT